MHEYIFRIKSNGVLQQIYAEEDGAPSYEWVRNMNLLYFRLSNLRFIYRLNIADISEEYFFMKEEFDINKHVKVNIYNNIDMYAAATAKDIVHMHRLFFAIVDDKDGTILRARKINGKINFNLSLNVASNIETKNIRIGKVTRVDNESEVEVSFYLPIVLPREKFFFILKSLRRGDKCIVSAGIYILSYELYDHFWEPGEARDFVITDNDYCFLSDLIIREDF